MSRYRPWGGIREIVVLWSMLALFVWASTCLAEDSFAVIVNRDNPLSGTPEELSNLVARIFLKQQTEWPNHISPRVYDRELDSPAHQQFVQQILKMSEGRLAVHWVKMKQVSGETPPRVIRSHGILLRFIEKHKGGMGVIHKDTVGNLPPSIKVLFSF